MGSNVNAGIGYGLTQELEALRNKFMEQTPGKLQFRSMYVAPLQCKSKLNQMKILT